MSKTIEQTLASRAATVMSIGLHELHLDPLNVRSDMKEDTVLTASIEAHGLQTPLIVRKNGKGWGVIAGGKRLLSLQKLYPDALSCLVPCVVMDSKMTDLAAVEASLAENVARTEMRPVAMYRAFKALADDPKNPLSIEDIAKRFGQSARRVEQLLALGNLEPSVLAAYDREEIAADVVRVMTMIAPKVQKSILAKIKQGEVHPNAWNVRQAAGLTSSRDGHGLALIGEEAYVKRGGKIIRDLFTDDHSISDPALLKTMVEEAIAAKVEALKAEGYTNATSERPANWYMLNVLRPTLSPTKAEAKELKRLEAIIAENENADEFDQEREDAAEQASKMYDALELEITQRAMTPALKAKAICIVSLDHKGTGFEIELRTPQRAPSTEKKAAEKKEAKAALPIEDTISQALRGRLHDALTDGASQAILHQQNVALACVLASITSRDSSHVKIGRTGTEYDPKSPSFKSAFVAALKLKPAVQIAQLVGHIGRSLSLRSFNGDAMDQDDVRAIVDAIDGKRLTFAIRQTFQHGEYFDSVPKTIIADAVGEAMGEDHAAKVAKMDKASASKFATEHLSKAKWLPKQLRVKGYDGPARKAAPKKSAAKKSVAKKKATRK